MVAAYATWASSTEMAFRVLVKPDGTVSGDGVQNNTFTGSPGTVHKLDDFTQWTYAGTVDADGNTKEAGAAFC